MLTGNLVRVRHIRNKVVPQYLDPNADHWRDVAEQLIFVYSDAPGHTRSEIEEELSNLVGEGPGQLVHQGLAKLLDDRCDYETATELNPAEVRESVFRIAALQRKLTAKTGVRFDRALALAQVSEELQQPVDVLEQALFADLAAEQKVLKFAPITAEQLLHRYNVSLAQAVLVRSTSMEAVVRGESPARFRQLFRAVKFHRLICTIRESPPSGYTLMLDGPLSLFSSTQKYGLQLALFLPTLLHCKSFRLTAEVLWGAERKRKTFELDSSDGLRSPAPDFGTYTPPEFAIFAENLRDRADGWTLAADPTPVSLGADGLWVPDFKLTHDKTGREVYLECFGYWRRGNLDAQYRKLQKRLPGQFLLVVSEAMRADETDGANFGPEVVRYKRTPSADAVLAAADALID
jgi:predicted nuclease of restriction endonuclease-like RecB superfamily